MPQSIMHNCNYFRGWLTIFIIEYLWMIMLLLQMKWFSLNALSWEENTHHFSNIPYFETSVQSIDKHWTLCSSKDVHCAMHYCWISLPIPSSVCVYCFSREDFETRNWFKDDNFNHNEILKQYHKKSYTIFSQEVQERPSF